MSKERVWYLLSAWLEDKINEEEKQELIRILNDSSYNLLINEVMAGQMMEDLAEARISRDESDTIAARIISIDKTNQGGFKRGRILSIRRWSAAAAVVLIG